MLRLEFEDEEYEKEKYLKSNLELWQRDVVNCRSAATSGTTSYIWTYRQTYCDVVSVVTTTQPTKYGAMKEIRFKEATSKKLKPAVQKNSNRLDGNPLRDGLMVSEEVRKKRVADKLHSEKVAFMNRLKMSRNIRTFLETKAAVIIQAAYRGCFIRKNFEKIAAKVTHRNDMRARMINYLRNHSTLVSSWGEYRFLYSYQRDYFAVIIQCAFRCFVSRKCLIRKRMDVAIERHYRAAIKIQALMQVLVTSRRVAKEAIAYRLQRAERSALRIQTKTRQYFARQRVRVRRFRLRWVAATIIQGWYRSSSANAIIKMWRETNERWHKFISARTVQCMIRCFLANRRTMRIKLRMRFVFIHRVISKIQAIIRGFNGRVRVKRRRLQLKAYFANKKMKALEEAREKEEEQTRASNQKLLESADIYRQAELGNITDVDDIFHGRVDDEKRTIQDTNEAGDTLLTIAAGIGNMDFCRKCLKWGFDINHRNIAGLTPLILAVKNGHVDLAQYLLVSAGKYLAPTGEGKSRRRRSMQDPGYLDPLNEEDTGTLLCLAASAPERIEILKSLLNLELNVNERDPETGYIALHAACENNNIEAVRLLMKLGANVESLDDLGQSPLHKACCGSLELVKILLGTEHDSSHRPTMSRGKRRSMNVGVSTKSLHEDFTAVAVTSALKEGIEVAAASSSNGQAASENAEEAGIRAFTPGAALGSEADSGADTPYSMNFHSEAGDSPMRPHTTEDVRRARAERLLVKDLDNKDCQLLAALAGKSDILAYIDEFVMLGDFANDRYEEVGWSPNDIIRAQKLVADGAFEALSFAVEAGFDPTWVDEDNGITLAMVACKHGTTKIIDYLISLEADFSTRDSNGQNVLHYAAQCKHIGVIAYVLSAANLEKSQITADMLLIKDNSGQTPLHIAASEGVDFAIDLIAGDVVFEAMKIKDFNGMTPLLLACSNYYPNVMKRCIQLNADVKTTCNQGHDCLWHILHPNANVSKRPRPILCSEKRLHAVLLKYRSSKLENADDPEKAEKAEKTEKAENVEKDVDEDEEEEEEEDDEEEMEQEVIYPGGKLSVAQDEMRLNGDVYQFKEFLRLGCTLYRRAPAHNDKEITRIARAAEMYRWELIKEQKVISDKHEDDFYWVNLDGEMESMRDNAALGAGEWEDDYGDTVVKEVSLTLLNELPETASPLDCWRLVISALQFDDDDCACLKGLIEGDVFKKLGAYEAEKDSLAHLLNPPVAEVRHVPYTVAHVRRKKKRLQSITAMRKPSVRVLGSADSSAVKKESSPGADGNSEGPASEREKGDDPASGTDDFGDILSFAAGDATKSPVGAGLARKESVKDGSRRSSIASRKLSKNGIDGATASEADRRKSRRQSTRDSRRRSSVQFAGIRELQEEKVVFKNIITKAAKAEVAKILKTSTFLGLTLAGWAVRLGNVPALKIFLQLGADPTLPVDTKGNSLLHVVARYSKVETMEMLMDDTRFHVRLECENTMGHTPAAEAVLGGNVETLKFLMSKKARMRRALKAKWTAYALVMARRQEQREINTQTGRYAEDDRKYYSMFPDPEYTQWYL